MTTATPRDTSSVFRDESLEESFVRASMRVRTAQSMRTLPFVAATLIVLAFALHDRVHNMALYTWFTLMAATTLLRAWTCMRIAKRIDLASLAQIRTDERWLWVTLIANTLVIGSSFWWVASTTPEPTVKFVITLTACFYAIGSMVNASSHFASFAVGALLNFGQGLLFWLGVGPNELLLEVAVPYGAVALLVIGFGRESSRQFLESIRIRKQNVALLKQLERDKSTIEKALTEARLASESKSKFLAAASHDLRQPLHALAMFLGTMSFHVTTDDAKRLLGRIKDTTSVLEEQFDSLLDLSKFDAGAVDPEIAPFRLDRLIVKVVEEVRPEAEAKSLTIASSGSDAVVLSDQQLVARVLRNLVANAVKYTSVGSVTVRIEPQSECVFVEVIDTGPGIPEDQQARIFEEYVQLANPARQRRHGVGLGLAIVKRIDTLLNLRLSLRSATGFGSRFGFSLPLASEDPAQDEHPEPFDVTTFRTSARVWLLDDDPNVLDGLREQLTAWGAEVDTFTHPMAMLERLRSRSELPSWIFSDDMLGAALSGLETAQILSSEFGFERVCLLTGNTEQQRLAQLRASGFPVLIKPARAEALVALLTHEE